MPTSERRMADLEILQLALAHVLRVRVIRLRQDREEPIDDVSLGLFVQAAQDLIVAPCGGEACPADRRRAC